MKDITDYFRGSANYVSNTISPPRETKKASENGGKKSPTTPKSKNTRKRNSRTPRSKNKISPRTSPLEGFKLLFKISQNDPLEKKTDLKMESPVEVVDIQDSENSVELHDTTESTNSKSAKLNAFQLLMMSRNKVIGSNSPGKELPDQGNTRETSPPKLFARKRLLQSWSDSIKAKKRKLNDEEIDKYIKVKLNTRKERLKSLLNVDNDPETVLKETPKSKKRTNSIKAPSNEVIEISPNNTEELVKKRVKTPVSTKMNKSLSSGDDFESKVENGTKISTPKSSRVRQRESTKNSAKMSTPKSTWKLKIKLINRDSEDEKSSDRVDEISDIIILDESENSLEEVANKVVEYKSEIVEVEATNSPNANKEVLEIEEANISKRVLRDRTCLNKNKTTDYLELSDDSGDEAEKKSNKRPVKVAPVFAKAMPKQKIDKTVLEARRKFLMSDMPDVLRKRIEKHTSNTNMVDEDFDVFPKVSHVHQEENDNNLWDLPSPNLKLKTVTPFDFESIDQLCRSLIENKEIKQSKYKESDPIKNIKTIMRDMKLENENYPVYKAFRLLKAKNGIATENTPKRGRKRKSSSEKKRNSLENMDQQNTPKYQMWTEKYKPRSSEDFFSNVQAVSSVKKWLEKWREVLESGKRKRRQYSSDSESDFMSSDAESVYDRSLATTIVLAGPCGSGKSSSVYAVCNELGLNVLELNASSRRTGKQIIQELQEATQSHQVRKNKGTLDSFTNKGPTSKAVKETERKSKKMCVLLIEDIDIVFEQDDGFLSAISQISSTSKRPIVLTTSNENSVYAQKFINDFKTIRFHHSSVKSSGIWLQILCLLEGIFIDLSSIGELLEYNRGDMRKTLLELQYWVQSGGQTNKLKTLLDPIFEIESLKEDGGSIPIFDDTPSLPLKECNEKLDDYRLHSNILSDFEIFQLDRYYNIPPRVDLKTLWWNIPKFLYPAKPKHETKSNKFGRKNKKRLKIVSAMYDSVAALDVAYRKIGFKSDDPVCRKRWHCRLQDSLELDERSSVPSFDQNMLELNHFLTNGHLGVCKEKFIYEFSKNQRFCNMAMPTLNEERRLNNNHKYEEELLKPVPSLNNLDHKSVVLDYLPCLRTIARTENVRAKNNVKRHNRFHNYLQNLNITCDTPILDFATQTFSNSKWGH